MGRGQESKGEWLGHCQVSWPQESGTDQLETIGLSSSSATNVARNIWLPPRWGFAETLHSLMPDAYVLLGQPPLLWGGPRILQTAKVQGVRRREGHRDEETLSAHMQGKLSVLHPVIGRVSLCLKQKRCCRQVCLEQTPETWKRRKVTLMCCH